MNTNLEIRNYAEEKKVKLWQIANVLGMNDGNFSRKLRTELSDDKKLEIIAIIDAIAEEGK